MAEPMLPRPMNAMFIDAPVSKIIRLCVRGRGWRLFVGPAIFDGILWPFIARFGDHKRWFSIYKRRKISRPIILVLYLSTHIHIKIAISTKEAHVMPLC